MGFQRIDYTNIYRKVRNRKYEALFEFKPELNPVVVCAFHPSEGCLDCGYIERCVLKI